MENTRTMTRNAKGASAAVEARILDSRDRREMDVVRLDLGPHCAELDGTHAELRIDDGAVLVEALHPAGDPLFKAMPNAGIENAVRQALRALVAATLADPVADADGRRIHAEGCMLYPPHMDDAPRPGADAPAQGIGLAGVGIAAVAAVLFLVAADVAHPLVLLLLPGVGIGAWALIQARRHADARPASIPDYEGHLRRGRAQAVSISRAASRARGLST